MGVESGLLRFSAVFLLTPAGESDQQQVAVPALSANAASRVVAVEPGQTDIEQDDIWPECSRCLYRLQSIVRQIRVVAGELEQHREAFRRVPVVIDDQNAP